MEKKDLKAGYTLLDEKGRHWHLFEAKDGLKGRLIKNYIIDRTVQIDVDKALKDDLTLKLKYLNPDCNIVKVYGFAEFMDSIFRGDFIGVEVLWERYPKTKVTLELTDEQIESLKKQGIL